MMLGHAMLMAAGAGATSAGWRYIRFYMTANNGDQYTAIQEIELATAISGADITTTTSPTNQDVYYTANANGNAFNKVVDNNFSEYTNSTYVTDGTALPHWGWIDLATPKIVVQAKIWPQNYSGGPARAPKDFIVQGSNDATTWTAIKAFSGVTGWVAGTGKTFNLLDGTWA